MGSNRDSPSLLGVALVGIAFVGVETRGESGSRHKRMGVVSIVMNRERRAVLRWTAAATVGAVGSGAVAGSGAAKRGDADARDASGGDSVAKAAGAAAALQ